MLLDQGQEGHNCALLFGGGSDDLGRRCQAKPGDPQVGPPRSVRHTQVAAAARDVRGLYPEAREGRVEVL